jgi:hypothetical protein
MLRLARKSRQGTKLMAMADGARKTIAVAHDVCFAA